VKRRKRKPATKVRKLRRARQARWNATPRGQFSRQRSNARARGVPWEMDFETWERIWRESGRYAMRGAKPGNYQMARIGDVGPYMEGNVIIVKLEANAYACLIQSGRARFDPQSQYATEVATIL
jgi:hypothetical protein